MNEFSAEFNGDTSKVVVGEDSTAGTVARFEDGYGLTCVV
jgi:hypothetical protein